MQADSSYLSFFTLPVTAVWYSTPRPWGGRGAQGEWRGRGEVSDLRSRRGRWCGGTAGRQPSGENHGRVAGRRQTVSVVKRLWGCGAFGLTPCRAAVWGRQRRWCAWGPMLERAERRGSQLLRERVKLWEGWILTPIPRLRRLLLLDKFRGWGDEFFKVIVCAAPDVRASAAGLRLGGLGIGDVVRFFGSCAVYFIMLRRSNRFEVGAKQRRWSSRQRGGWNNLLPSRCAAWANPLQTSFWLSLRACCAELVWLHKQRSGDASVRLPVNVVLTINRRWWGELGGKLQGNGGHTGGCWARVTEGQGHGVDRPAGGVRPLQSSRQDRKAAFSQDGSEEGESGERRPVPGRRGLGTDRGGQTLARWETGLREVNQTRARRQKVPLDLDDCGGKDAREDGRAGRDSAAEGDRRGDRGNLSSGPAPLREDGLSGWSRGGEHVSRVCGARSVLWQSICKETRANLSMSGSVGTRPPGNVPVFISSCFHRGCPGSDVVGRILRPSGDWRRGFGLREAHEIRWWLELKKKRGFSWNVR